MQVKGLVHDGLEALCAKFEDWEGLVDVLSTAADKATDPTLKVDLSFRAMEAGEVIRSVIV